MDLIKDVVALVSITVVVLQILASQLKPTLNVVMLMLVSSIVQPLILHNVSRKSVAMLDLLTVLSTVWLKVNAASF